MCAWGQDLWALFYPQLFTGEQPWKSIWEAVTNFNWACYLLKSYFTSRRIKSLQKVIEIPAYLMIVEKPSVLEGQIESPSYRIRHCSIVCL